MTGRPQKPRVGRPIKKRPGAFPLFADGRQTTVVTADAWSFLRQLAIERLPRVRESRALAYLDQAQDFYEAAANPRLGSKPLLYYYSFLNLAKAGLVVSGVPLAAKATHGISDPQVNQRRRVRLAGQRVQWTAPAHDRSAVFPELLRLLGVQAPTNGSRSLRELLAQIPAVHRTFSRVVKSPNAFLPIHGLSLLQSEGELWARFSLKRGDANADSNLRRVRTRQAFRRLLHQVQADTEDEYWFESSPVPGARRGVDNGIRSLAGRLRDLGLGFILTHAGYRLYFSDVPPRHRLPQLAASYAAMFYLGSVTRYKPHDFSAIVSGGYSWIVSEFFATQPLQFVYGLASTLAGCAVTRPYAALG